MARNAACNAVIQLVDVGTDYSSAGIYLFDSTDIPLYQPDSSSPVARLAMSSPAFLDATDGTAYSNPITDNTAIRDATVTGFGVYNRDSTFIFGGTVSTSAADMILNPNIIYHDQTAALTSAYYLVP